MKGSDRLAARWGVQTTYENYRKETQTVPTATVERVLEIMEAGPEGPPSGIATILRRDDARTTPLPEVTSIETEDGGSVEVRGGRIPRDLPLGYHRAIDTDGRARPLILSPGSCFLPEDMKAWGWALQLYSLRSSRSWGIGDLGDLRRFASWSASLGGSEVMLNPLHAALPLSGQQPSPYFPSSRCFRNPIYLAIEDVEGATASDEAKALAEEGLALNATSTIDRDPAYRLKLDALEIMWRSGPGRGFDTYLAEQGDLLWGYATFAAIAESYDAGPAAWPEELARGDRGALRAWTSKNQDRVRFHAWLQWLLEQQMASAGEEVGLVNDLAIGVDPQGADAWMWRDVFATGATVGAPPDEFNLRGQGWGLPPFDPWKLRSAAYEPFIRTIRSAFRHSAGIRIDHVMGLFRLYWIPDGVGPEAGTYVRYPHEDLLNIVALESHRAQAYVVGEDLGTVEDSVRAEMQERKILSYRLLWFEENEPKDYPSLALAAVANHDVPTIAGLWSGADVEAQRAVGLEVNEEGLEVQKQRLRGWLDLTDGSTIEDVVLAIYGLLAAAPSAVIMATLEDVLGMEERPNMPGTMDERPNWSIPLALTLEELQSDPRVLKVAELLSRKRPVSSPKKSAS